VNPPNDWEIKKCLSLSLAILLATLGLVGLAGLGFDVPGLRHNLEAIFDYPPRFYLLSSLFFFCLPVIYGNLKGMNPLQ